MVTKRAERKNWGMNPLRIHWPETALKTNRAIGLGHVVNKNHRGACHQGAYSASGEQEWDIRPPQ